MKKFFAIASIALLAVTLLAISGGVALAQTTGNTQVPSGFSCSIFSGDWAPCLGNWIANSVSQTIQLFILIGGWLIQVGLQLNANIYNSPDIQAGFGICLSIANLGFVLAMIVIALATIFHSETYGYKKTLWRLVVMAVLVNFGLVITAPLVSFAGGMTSYFQTNISSGVSGIGAFINTLAQTTNPGAASQPPPTSAAQCNIATSPAAQYMTPAEIQSACNASTQTPSAGNAVSQFFLALVFIIVFKIVVAIAFIAIGMLLIVRYIWLGVLLILLPFAWLTWIFPSFKAEFSKWWSNFIKWTFFAPAAMFFISLALAINKAGVYATQVANTGNAGTNTPAVGLAAAIGNSTFLGQFMSNIIVVGIMIGGLIAASSLTGKAGSFVVAQAKGVSGAMTGYVGRRTKQGVKRVATMPMRTQPIKNLATSLQQRSNSKLVRNTGVDWAKRKIGQGLEAGAIAGGVKAVSEAAGRFKDMTPDQRRNRLSGVEWENAPAQRMALLKQVMEDKNLKKLSSDEMDRYFGKAQEETFKRFGQEKLYKDLREKSGLGLRDLDKEIETLKAQPQPLTAEDTQKLADKESEKIKVVASYIRENPDEVADSFTDPKKLKDKREKSQKELGYVPASLEEDSLNRMQKSITEGIASGLSPEIVSTLIKEVSKKNNLDPFGSAVKRHSDADHNIRLRLAANNRMLHWNDTQFNRGALDVNLRDLYGVPAAPIPNPTPTP